MELRSLRYVVAVARWRNFTRAAGELHVAQPALSRAIRDLETELGVRLFDRTSRRVTVTAAGTAFVAHASRILERVDALGDDMAEFSGAIRGRVRLSVWYHIDPGLPMLLRDFIAENPNVEVDINELPGAAMLEAVRQGDIDIAVPFLTPTLDLTDIEYEIVREEPVVLAGAPDGPLASLTSVTLQDLSTIRLVAPRIGTSWRLWFDLAVAAGGIRPPIVVETNEVSAAVAYASAGIGATILPRRVIEAVGRPVAMVPIIDAPPLVTALAWSRTRYRGPAAERALAFIRAAAERARAGENAAWV